MFEQSILRNAERKRKPATLAVSAVLQAAVVGAMVLAPLAFTDHLNWKPDFTPHPPIRGPKRFVEIVRPEGRMPPPVVRSAHTLFAPTVITPISTHGPDRPMLEPPIVTDSDYGDRREVIGWDDRFSGPVMQRTAALPPAPPPVKVHREAPVAAPPPARDPIRVSLGVQMAKIIHQPRPEYSAIARSTRTQGVVKLIGIIGRDGTIQQLRVVSGHPLLVNAAVAAVRQWRYQPTLLSGVPVEVEAPIEVNFVLQ